jgi:hypothetical protein
MSKRKTFLIVYAIFIIVALIYILFFADSKYFIKKQEPSGKTTTKQISIEEQKKNLLKDEYEYHYDINHNGVSYYCKGSKTKEEYTGTCETKDNKIEYNEENYKEKLKDLNTNYMDPEYIFNMIKDLKPEEDKLLNKYYYKYNVNIDSLPGEISLHSNSKRITQITVANGNIVYVLYYE